MTKYVNITRLGIGGFGEVWKVRREEDGKLLAKKSLLSGVGHDAERRFVREVRLLSKMDHPNVVKVVRSRLKAPPYYFVMPLYQHSLAEVLKDVIGDESRSIPIFSAILDAIEYAHGEGIIHRDLKPGNVLMNDDHDLVVSDFGLGRDVNSTSTRRTNTGGQGGTKFYWPPEQQTNFKKATKKSDIFTLGRILYELYTKPLKSHSQDLPLPGHIAFIVNKCTQSRPNNRFSDITELKDTWLQATDEDADVSPEQEINEMVSALITATKVASTDVHRLADLLHVNRDDSDLIHAALMRLPPAIVHKMFSISPSSTREIVTTFVDQAASQSWGFSYTDKIGNQCVKLYSAIEDYHIRAELTYCLLEVGISHSRWQVQSQAKQLVEHAKLKGESLALVSRLKTTSQTISQWIKENCAIASLDTTLRRFLGIRTRPPQKTQ